MSETMPKDQMTRQEAIEAGWTPIQTPGPKNMPGVALMWRSPCGRINLFCPPTYEYQEKYLRGQVLDELVAQAQELDMGY
jgi:hypothetical protein